MKPQLVEMVLLVMIWYHVVKKSGATEVINAWSSSHYGSKLDYGPQLAWKGGSTKNTGFFHSKEESNPWLMIELKKQTTINSLKIINRKDCCGERLKNLVIRSGMKKDLTNPVIGEFKGPGSTRGRHRIVLNGTAEARFINFQIVMDKAILQINGIRLNNRSICCESVDVTVTNDVQKKAHSHNVGSLAGIYTFKGLSNEYPYWIGWHSGMVLGDHALWYNPVYNDWNIGIAKNLGTSVCGIHSFDNFGTECPTDEIKEWKYLNKQGQWAKTYNLTIKCKDCCELMRINLAKDVQKEQGSFAGNYIIKGFSNNRQYWLKEQGGNHAIWYYPEYNYWVIGKESHLGTKKCFIHSWDNSKEDCPTDEINLWLYWHTHFNSWTRTRNVTIECLDGLNTTVAPDPTSTTLTSKLKPKLFTGKTNQTPKENQKIVISLSSALGLLVLLVGISAAKKWYDKRKAFAPELIPDDSWQFDPNRSVEEQLSELPYDLRYEFPRLDIHLKRIIGEGKFGEIWEAMAEGIAAFRPKDDSELYLRSKLANIYAREHNGNDFWVKYFRQEYYPPQYSEEGRVAVKCLKPGAPEQDYTDLANELKLMIHTGKHKNIVNLHGACTQRGPLLVILEYCPYGDLRKFTRTKTLYPTWNPMEMETADQLCFIDLIRMSMEITEAMIFLSTCGIIHRDLAARNVLVGPNMEMKVADFGMARGVSEPGDEYNKESDAAIPVRWTAPEAMNMGTYTTSSDVWSLGVLLWELYSLGAQPYGGMSNFEVKLLVERGERMEPPTNCPENVYMLMKACWNQDSRERPDFMEIFELLLEIRRCGFAPQEDYYSGANESGNADIYTSDTFVDCSRVLRERRINWLVKAGAAVTEENVEELLQHMWGDGNIDIEENSKISTDEMIEIQQVQDNCAYDME